MQFALMTVLIMVAGTMFLMWIGDQITNVRSAKVMYQALLWSFRLWKWRDKTSSPSRITRKTLNLR